MLNNEDGYLSPWYGQYFLAYGMQRLGTSSIGQGREVFYINKLTYKTEDIGKVQAQRRGFTPALTYLVDHPDMIGFKALFFPFHLHALTFPRY